MSLFMRWYSHNLKRHPLAMNMVTTGSVFCLGDILSQQVLEFNLLQSFFVFMFLLFNFSMCGLNSRYQITAYFNIFLYIKRDDIYI